MRYTISPLNLKQADKLLATIGCVKYSKFVNSSTNSVILRIAFQTQEPKSFRSMLKKLRAKIVKSEATEECCANCIKRSVRGKYCYLHRIPVNLESVCDFHLNFNQT